MGRAALALVVAVTCSCIEPPTIHLPARGADGAPASLEVAWVNHQLRPVGPPVAVGAFAVGIVSVAARRLAVVGLEPATGRELWRQPLTPGAVTPGVRVVILPVGSDKLAYFRPTRVDAPYAELVLADAATGADVAKSPEALFASPPHRCSAGSQDVCATSRAAVTGEHITHRLEASGRYLATPTEEPPAARLIGAGGLLDLGDRPGNTLGLLRDGKIRWRTPVSAAFPPGFGTDHGWSWELFGKEHLFVGSVGGPLSSEGPNGLTFDLATTAAMAGLSEVDGSVVWRDDGSSFQCHLATGRHPVRCRWRGTVISEESGDSFQNVDVTIEGFDVTTGKTTWSVPVGAETRLVGGDAHPPVAGKTEVLLSAAAGPTLLDFATGQVSAPRAGATFWCLSDTHYDFWLSYRTHTGATRSSRRGGVLASACDARAQPSTSLPDVAATLAVGAHVGDYVLLAVKDGAAQSFVGFRLPASAPPPPPSGPPPEVQVY